MGVVEGQMGFVVASYAATGLAIGGLIAWVWVGHRLARRELRRLEAELGGSE